MTDGRLRVLKKDTDQPVRDVWAIGDASVVEGPEMLPATAQVAAQKSQVRSIQRLWTLLSSLACSVFPLLLGLASMHPNHNRSFPTELVNTPSS